MGYWEKIPDRPKSQRFRCSKCGRTCNCIKYEGHRTVCDYKYCPYCREPMESEVKEMKKEEISLGYKNEEPPTCSCEYCKYELLSPEVEPCCDCKNAHKNYFEAKISEVKEISRKELIRYGKDYLSDLVTACCSISDIHKEFVRESIKALEQESAIDKIRAEIKALNPEPTAYDVVDGNPIKDAVWKTLSDVLKIIDKYRESEE